MGRDTFKADVRAQFAEMKAQFEEVHARFAEVDARFEQVDARFEQVDARFAQVDARFEQLERRITEEGQVTRRHFDVVAEQMDARNKVFIEASIARLDESARRVAEVSSTQVTLISALDDHELRLRVLERGRGPTR